MGAVFDAIGKIERSWREPDLALSEIMAAAVAAPVDTDDTAAEAERAAPK